MIPKIHTRMLLVKFAMALAMALMYFVTETPETLNPKIPNTEMIARAIK